MCSWTAWYSFANNVDIPTERASAATKAITKKSPGSCCKMVEGRARFGRLECAVVKFVHTGCQCGPQFFDDTWAKKNKHKGEFRVV